MAESISRALRDGGLDGEHAPALAITDSLLCPLGSHVFHHFLCSLLSNIAADKSQSRGLVIVAYRRSPSFYFDLMKARGLDLAFLDKTALILDCYSDPLGWKSRVGRGEEISEMKKSSTVFRDVKNISKLESLILERGKGLVGRGKARFAVVFDSVSDVLRHVSLPSVASLLQNLRSDGQVSCLCWLLHSDLHDHRSIAALEYISSMVANLEPVKKPMEGQHRVSENLFLHEQNSHSGKLHVRLQRRNGRVKVLCEGFHVDQVGVKFAAVNSETAAINQNLVPKVQFNLQLSEKELYDRAKVVLPFEHQGNGETIQIYDGRRSLVEGQKDAHLRRPISSDKANAEGSSGYGEIHYIRDSDDELPDSDEDPDDDLDI